MITQPKNLLIFYGYMNSFNSATNQWTNEKVAQDMAKYDICVFGNGVADPTHPDFVNAQIIIARLIALKPDIKIFGYVTANQALASFQTKVNQWDALNIQGIFMDEAGYDYGVTRDQFNEKVIYVHGRIKSKLCFANAWNMDHIIGTANDPNFPNSTYNPNLRKSYLNSSDWYLLESFSVNTLSYTASNGFALQADVLARGNKAVALSKQYGIKVAVSGVVDNASPTGQTLADFHYHSTVAFGFDAGGTSDSYYGASTAAVMYWARPTPRNIGTTSSVVVVIDGLDANICIRYGEFSRLLLNFTPNAQISSIQTW